MPCLPNVNLITITQLHYINTQTQQKSYGICFLYKIFGDWDWKGWDIMPAPTLKNWGKLQNTPSEVSSPRERWRVEGTENPSMEQTKFHAHCDMLSNNTMGTCLFQRTTTHVFCLKGFFRLAAWNLRSLCKCCIWLSLLVISKW